MYDNVIVPFDGSIPARAALAPAGDLAWRCGARIVIVTNTEVSDAASQQALKAKAMSMSGSDVDFWVDTEHTIGENVIDAAKHRPNSIVCIAVREKKGMLGRKPLLTETPAEVLIGAGVPVMVIGPEVDVTRGLPMTELVVPLDGSPTSEHVIPMAVEWATSLKLRIVLVGVVKAGSDDHSGEIGYLQAVLDELREVVPDSEYQLVEAGDPAAGIIAALEERRDSIAMMSTHGRSGVSRYALGGVAQAVLLGSPRVMVFDRLES